MLGISLEINFTVDWEVKFKTWNGRFLNRLVSEVLESAGVRVSHNDAKPFTISPILDRGRVAGRLVPGEPYWFRVSLMCNAIDCSTTASAFIRDTYTLSSGEVVRILKVRAREFNLNVDASSSSNRSIIKWRVRYYPTVFPFAHHYIVRPSSTRFLASTAKTLAQLLMNTEIVLNGGNNMYNAIISNIDFKNIVKDLAFNTELTNYRVKRLRIDLGNGRVMPAFSGVAEYITQTTNPGLLNVLLDVAEFFGVGKNKALGFGFVRITHRTVKSKP